VLKIVRLSCLVLLSVVASTLWAQDPVNYDSETYDSETPSGVFPFFDCTQFDGMDFWIWSEYTYRESGTLWLGPGGAPTQWAFEGSIHDPKMWVPRDKNCHAPPFDGCEPDRVLRGMKLKLLPPYEKWWETWGDWVDAGPDWGWVPSWISRSGVFFTLNTPNMKMGIHYEGSYLKGVNASAPGVEPYKPADQWGIEWLSPGFMPPFNDDDGSFNNLDDLYKICDGIMHGEGN